MTHSHQLVRADNLKTQVGTSRLGRNELSALTARPKLTLIALIVLIAVHSFGLVLISCLSATCLGIPFRLTGTLLLVLSAANFLCFADILSQVTLAKTCDRMPVLWSQRLLCYCSAFSVLVVVTCCLIESSLQYSFSTLNVALGIPLLLLGVLTRSRSIVALNRQFVSAISFDTCSMPTPVQLVSHDIYSVIRHPGEVGLNIAILAIVLLSGAMNAMLVWMILMLPLSVWRVKSEQRQLAEAFKHDYDLYASRVSAVIPLKWLSSRLLCTGIFPSSLNKNQVSR